MRIHHKLKLAVKLLRKRGEGEFAGLFLTKYRSKRNPKLELIAIKSIRGAI